MTDAILPPAVGHASPQTQAPGEFLSFRLGSEEYAIDILKVQEIRSYETPTRLSSAPEFIRGVVNLRGIIVPLVDLRLRFGFTDVTYDASTVVIVLNIASRVVGVVVDSVSNVVQLSAAEIKEAPALKRVTTDSCITGIGSLHDRMLILLDIETLLCSADVGLMETEAVS